MKEESQYQAKRILHTYRLFIKNKSMTSAEVEQKCRKHFPSDKRTHQRDLALLESDGFITKVDKGRNTTWQLSTTWMKGLERSKLSDREVLSFHILKAYLKSFNGTTIEQDIKHITTILEEFAPGFNTVEEQFFGDQSFGTFDYSDKHEIIRQLVLHINEKNWIHISYSRNLDDTVHDYDIMPYYLYTYYGTLYLVAYHPKIQEPANFVIQNIQLLKKIENDVSIKAPPFNLESFKKKRFAVFGGELKKVKLLIKKNVVKFFENRNWHPSQEFINAENDGEKYLTMKVPLSYEFISWISWWGDGIKVISPPELIEKIKENLKNNLDQY